MYKNWMVNVLVDLDQSVIRVRRDQGDIILQVITADGTRSALLSEKKASELMAALKRCIPNASGE